MITPSIPVSNGTLIEMSTQSLENHSTKRWLNSHFNLVFLLLFFIVIILVTVLILSVIFVVRMSKIESQAASSIRVMHRSISKAVQDLSSQTSNVQMLSQQAMLPSQLMSPSFLQKTNNVKPIHAESFGPSANLTFINKFPKIGVDLEAKYGNLTNVRD